MSRAIGNDVVDLAAPDARVEARHPRFDARAFGAAERALIGAGPAAHARRWACWAAKEAAYKALRQEHPTLVFVPRRFEVVFDGGRFTTTGRVAVDGLRMPFALQLEPAFVHAIACRHGAAERVSRVLQLRPDEDPRTAARRAALASWPGQARLERVRRIPRLRTPAGTLPLSLSHHGRFVAFARAEACA